MRTRGRSRAKGTKPRDHRRRGVPVGLTISVEELAAALRTRLRSLRSSPLLVTQDGNPIAALVSLSGVDEETLALSTNPRFAALVRRSRARAAAEGAIPAAQLRAELGLSPTRRKRHIAPR